MSAEEKSARQLNKLYAQIVKGYSIAKWGKTKIYIKHFGIEEQFEIQDKYDEIYARASKQGLPSEEEALQTLIEEGAWSDKEEKDIEKQKQYVDGLRQSRKHLIIPSQVEQLSKQLDEAREELAEKIKIRESLLTNTCEKFADGRSNDYSIFLAFCSTERLEPLFTRQEFEELDKSELYELVGIYNQAMGPLDTENIKKIAIAPFFVNYYNLAGDNPAHFFKNPISELTYYQVNLLNYGKVFKSIFENVADIPDHVADDPDKLLDFAESQKKTQDSRQKAQEADGYSMVGANEEDLKSMGIKDGTTRSIFDLAKEKGGNLSMKDLG
tara:strand:+ start:9778 stop:10755 length:978 start_codon:yes stop_codon:yes gene_type:complete